MAAPPLSVLIADDNRDYADSLALLVNLWGYGVAVAYDGRSALQQAIARRPRVMLLDIGMPGLDGYQVAQCVRGRADLQAVILIAVTAYGDVARTLEAGFDLHLVKPVDPLMVEQTLGLVHRSCGQCGRVAMAGKRSVELRWQPAEFRQQLREIDRPRL